MRQVVVIGGLAAGPAAAARAAREDPGAAVTLIEAGEEIAWGVCELPHLVSGEIVSAAALRPFTAARFEIDKRVRVLTSHRAVSLDTQARQVHVQGPRGGGRELSYDSLVLATGTTPRRPRDGAARVLHSIAGAEALRQEVVQARGGRGAVLGAGYVGLLAADALARAGLQVTIFDRQPLPLTGFEPGMRRLVADRLAARGVAFVGHTEVRTGVVEGADVVVAALGSDPATELAVASRLELGTSGAIRVDERQETSVRGIYAAGDCAEVRHAVSGKPARVALATVAQRSGRVAGANAAGGAERMTAVVGALAFRVFDLELGSVGLSLDAAERGGLAAFACQVRGRSGAEALGGSALEVALVCERSTGRLLGANVAGEQGAALRLNILAAWVARAGTVADLAALDLAYAPVFSPLRDPLLVAAARAERDRRS